MNRIGAHMSIAGGFTLAIDRAIAIGANALQIFSSPPQRWDSSKISHDQAAAFKKKAVNDDVLPVFVHGTYLINLASNNTETVKHSKESLIADLQFCHDTGAQGVIFHFGSQEHGWDGKRDFLTHLIHEILENSPEDTEFIIENAAGTGYKIGSSLDELARMKNDIAHTRIKFCLDSAHALAAGYEFRTHETAKTFSHLVESTIGWQSVAAIHLNDSKVDVGKKRDLHENIGDGCIGIKGFESLLSHIPSSIPLILETPGVQGEGPNKQNVERVKTILTSVV